LVEHPRIQNGKLRKVSPHRRCANQGAKLREFAMSCGSRTNGPSPSARRQRPCDDGGSRRFYRVSRQPVVREKATYCFDHVGWMGFLNLYA